MPQKIWHKKYSEKDISFSTLLPPANKKGAHHYPAITEIMTTLGKTKG